MFIFCTNITSNRKLPSLLLENEYVEQSVSEQCKKKRLLVARKSQEDALPKKSKGVVLWYGMLKAYLRERNIRNKILLITDNCMRRILSEKNNDDEKIKENDNFEVLFFPASTISLFEPLYSKIIEKI